MHINPFTGMITMKAVGGLLKEELIVCRSVAREMLAEDPTRSVLGIRDAIVNNFPADYAGLGPEKGRARLKEWALARFHDEPDGFVSAHPQSY